MALKHHSKNNMTTKKKIHKSIPQMNKTGLFKRPCIRCNELFRPTSKFQKICPDCNKSISRSKESMKKRYFNTKEELDLIRHNATLAKWKALSRAYKLGKKVWGRRFTRERLSLDMDVPYTTVQRCLSLDRATITN